MSERYGLCRVCQGRGGYSCQACDESGWSGDATALTEREWMEDLNYGKEQITYGSAAERSGNSLKLEERFYESTNQVMRAMRLAIEAFEREMRKDEIQSKRRRDRLKVVSQAEG